ncbi:hypothetical protein [Marinivivus vitaminiproducens]|uniref:hypothetical protein n=1 Tax=Marinivivus vitaminiproducens TaxID=3035935 RepID=UPI00279CACDE|nr:phosphotransferase [Geminicoccaceae bacterium SCSIO 64248]
MLTRAAIEGLIPHQGDSCLLDHVVDWTAETIRCGAVSHGDPNNPLCTNGRLGVVAGLEYGLQAMALHGALLDDGNAQPVGYLASARDVRLHAERLDDPAHGTLVVEATRESGDAAGQVYAVAVRSEAGTSLVSARVAIIFPKPESGRS